MKLSFIIYGLVVFLFFGLSPMAYSNSCFTSELHKLNSEYSRPKIAQSSSDKNLLILEKARHRYKKKIDYPRIKKDLTELAQNGLKNFGKSKKQKLKEERIAADVFRTAYRIFSDDHTPPENFSIFVSDFGHLNDAIEAKDKSQIRKTARLMLVKLERKHQDISGITFRPASMESILEHSNGRVAQITSSLHKDISLDHYHDIRKWMRDFRRLYTMLNKHNPNVNYPRLAEKAASISDDMGEIKDELLTGKKAKKLPVKISAQTTEKIINFIEDFRLHGFK